MGRSDELWVDIAGYEGLYQVSSKGRVLGVKRGKTLSPRVNRDGYVKYALCRENSYEHKLAHRLVAEHFLPPAPDGARLVLHGTAGVSDNSVDNLYWGTPKMNMADRFRDGTDKRSITKSCKDGHAYTDENTYINPRDSSRSCKICRRNSMIKYKASMGMEKDNANNGNK